METERMTVALGADHAGVALKRALREAVAALGHGALDLGTDGEASVDYPDYARAVAEAVASGRARFGVLVCGTGLGVSIAANRHPAIRCAAVSDATAARLARAHNDANVIALGARLTGPEVALDAVRAFLATPYEGGRHDRRVRLLSPDWTPPA